MRKQLVIWTRFSSEMQRTDSCGDQERKVREGLSARGIDHSHAKVFKVEAVSGTKLDGAQFVELMEMINSGKVALLAVDDQSRFSRGDQAFATIKDLVYSGGRFISTGECIDTDEPGWELKVKVLELHHSTTIRELGRRVRRGQEGRVLDGNGSAGDFCFGYRAEFLDPTQAVWTGRGPKPKKVIVIYESEAKVVRMIFAWFVEGMSICAIVRKLNELKIDKGHRSTKPGWHHQIVRRILGNAKYIGIWTWGRTQTLRDSRGRKKQVPVEQLVVIEKSRPELRIIADETWAKAQKLLKRLNDAYGKKPHQRPRGPRVHHTELYPSSLLGGLVFCGTCGARLTVQPTATRKYLGCPNYRNGTCTQVRRVPMDRAEKALVGLVGAALTVDSGWVEVATASLRRSLTDMAAAVPDSLAADQRRLKEVDRSIDNLVVALADGMDRSSAIREKLSALEHEAETLRELIDRQLRLAAQPLELPDDAWIRDQLADLASVLAEDAPAAAISLRRLIGKVTAHEVKIRGKKRGYTQLRFSIDVSQALAAAVEHRVDVGAVADAANGLMAGRSPEITIDLGSTSRMDRLAPRIAELREQGVPWNEIGRITRLGPGNAWTAWKRWMADADDDSEAA